MLPGDEDPPTPSPPDTPPERSKLKQRLHSLRSPFRTVSPFHIGSGKRASSTKSIRDEFVEAMSSQPASKSRKKLKKSKTMKESESEDARASSGSRGAAAKEESQNRVSKSSAGSLARKLSGMRRAGRCKADEDTAVSSGGSQLTLPSTPAARVSQATSPQPAPPPPPPPPQTAPPPPPTAPLALPEDIEVDAHLDAARGMDSPLPSLPPSTPSSERESPPPLPEDSASAATVVATHPVSTLPFTKSAWKRRATPEIARPVEEASPGDALRRRIAFVAHASTYLSEERAGEDEEEEEEVGSLERVVELARERLARAAGDVQRADTGSSAGDEDMPAYGDLFVSHGRNCDDVSTPHSSSHATSGSERREHLYKILVIGELGAGKTSIIKRYVHQFFSQHYRATIGVDFALKVLNWDANTVIRLQLWDIAGQERFGNMTRVYYKEAVGAFIVFDVTRAATFDAVLKWKTDLDSKVQLPDGSPIPCILLANKCDQQKEGIANSPAKLEEYCREKGFAGWFETSAKENVNIEEAARSLVNKILLNDKLLHSSDSKDNDRIALDHRIANGDNGQSGSSKNCAC